MKGTGFLSGAALALCATSTAAAEVPLAMSADDPALEWGACPPVFPSGCEVAILHGNPAGPNADALLRVPAGYVIPPHTHSSAERMVLVRGTLKVRYKGHPTSTLNAGDYAYGPAGLPHEATCESTGQCVLFIAFEKPVDAEAYAGAIE